MLMSRRMTLNRNPRLSLEQLDGDVTALKKQISGLKEKMSDSEKNMLNLIEDSYSQAQLRVFDNTHKSKKDICFNTPQQALELI